MLPAITPPPARVSARRILTLILTIPLILSLSATTANAAVTPDPVDGRLRLFDYTVLKEGTADNQATCRSADGLAKGINSKSGQAEGNLLKFQCSSIPHPLPDTMSPLMKRILSAPVNWYKYDPAAEAVFDWSKPKADADGYPVSRTGDGLEQSAAYLFDDTTHAGKREYPVNGAGGLLSRDKDGYWLYDSWLRAAYYDPASRRFESGTANRGFWPFDRGSTFATDDDLYRKPNHYFGISYRQPFTMTMNGEDGNGNPMVFDFRGDDDLWVVMDGVVILSLSGPLFGRNGSINLKTGAIIQRGNGGDQAKDTRTSTIRERFRLAGVTPAGGFSGDTFAPYTRHTMGIYYLERGAYASNLRIRFNLNVRYPHLLHYDPNPGKGDEHLISGSTPDAKGLDGDRMRIASNGFTYVNHRFLSWNTKADGTGTTYHPGDGITMPDEGVTLYAQWEHSTVGSLPSTGGIPWWRRIAAWA
ncbi:hypothetical protein [Bifidobacterium sp. SO1]|uniref:hypothetical protein n=1 Tax=Bifidobacterium sp. SO1 TaxID=2809029 RepID=UPI001BDCFA31|nr:hypothetical protein [Bifidobacterium sp. SO1]MBT1161803.1 hypothetical protein [Bifidobacterium sp. SO1]